VENGIVNPVTCESCRLCFKGKDQPAIQPVYVDHDLETIRAAELARRRRDRNLRPYQRQAIVHLNGDPDDNRPENLATVIPSRNPGQQFIWPQPAATTPEQMDVEHRAAIAEDGRRGEHREF
jgi:hypothetical protein